MNFLAHCALAGDDPDLVVGGFLGDFIKGPVPDLPGQIALGVRLHRRIDAITATEPGIRESVLRLGPELRRTGGIFVDLAGDHFLARHFARHHSVVVDDFSADVYRQLAVRQAVLPAPAVRLLDHMCRTDLLSNYRESAVLARAFQRIGDRLRRPELGGQALAAFERHYDALEADFADYYPALQQHVADWLAAQDDYDSRRRNEPER